MFRWLEAPQGGQLNANIFKKKKKNVKGRRKTSWLTSKTPFPVEWWARVVIQRLRLSRLHLENQVDKVLSLDSFHEHLPDSKGGLRGSIVDGRRYPLSTESQGIWTILKSLCMQDWWDKRQAHTEWFCAYLSRVDKYIFLAGEVCPWKCDISQLIIEKAKLSELPRMQLGPGLS